jgi:hypothetical protein
MEKLIIGEWTFAYKENKKELTSMGNQVPLPPFVEGNIKQGFTFFENGVCENKLGYFKKAEGKILFLGTKTKYKIENNSLKILNLTDSVWVSSKIYALNSDTLTLTDGDSLFVKYAKANYEINNESFFDKIIVSSSGCYGTCPISDICIDKQGNVFFSGQYYNTMNGLFTSKISPDKYTIFESNFKKADIENLETSYSAIWTDDETITVTFIKDNKIAKTISDYGRQAPTEFYWAYLPIRYLYQQLDLDAYTNSKKLPLFIYYFETINSIYRLSKSEHFFLLTELYNGELVQQNFDEKYMIECEDWQREPVKLITDGRYYKYEQQSTQQVIDIGYNFIEKNNLREQLKENEMD